MHLRTYASMFVCMYSETFLKDHCMDEKLLICCKVGELQPVSVNVGYIRRL